ncbi:MAG: class I SAM-dependent methyltransferase [Candidatus Verstraetearchaeota archaeon]|nr:class I SAM-dependent methyltransferase [Candidatus Verstraetearchaeota archaeon]
MKPGVAEEYDASSATYDSLYKEEQEVKFGFLLNRVRPGGGEEVVLDAGCGTGLLLEALSRRWGCTLVGLDSSEGMLREAKRKGTAANLVLGDIEKMPFKDGSFDIAFSVSVIQLADDPEEAIGEIRRVLKKGGRVGISYLRRAGIAVPRIRGLRVAVHDSETMKDIFLTGYRE